MGQEVWQVQSDCFFCIKKKPYKSRDDLGFLVYLNQMNHKISDEDFDFLSRFENCEIEPENFHHREHIRIAYILLTKLSVEKALLKLKDDLLSFLDYIGADKSKYHETLTCAWLLAVNHFMHLSPPAAT